VMSIRINTLSTVPRDRESDGFSGVVSSRSKSLIINIIGVSSTSASTPVIGGLITNIGVVSSSGSGWAGSVGRLASSNGHFEGADWAATGPTGRDFEAVITTIILAGWALICFLSLEGRSGRV
jgi:hypothetical protein